MGPVEKIMREKLNSILMPPVLELVCESHMHGLPREAEKHFKLVAVSETFAGQSRIDRQRLVNSVLADELATHVHALTMQLFTPEEWRAREESGEALRNSPECLGGGKHDRRE